MTGLWLQSVASNVVVATLLVAVAAAVARWTQRPAVVHALCVLALLKLVTPPLVHLPVLPAAPKAALTPQWTSLVNSRTQPATSSPKQPRTSSTQAVWRSIRL